MTSYGPSSDKLPTLSKYSKQTFFLESTFADIRNSGLPGCGVREKGTLVQKIIGIFEIFENPFLSQNSQNVSVVQSGSGL